MADEESRPIPAGWAVAETGAPTTDAARGLRGGLVQAGGAKGYALAFMIDALVALGGAELSCNVSPLHGSSAEPQRLGYLFIAIDVPDPASIQGAVEALMVAVRQSSSLQVDHPDSVM